MALINELVLSYAGRPIVVMGGAPGLPEEVKRVNDASCWISANEHGAKLRKCDYIVYVDRIHQQKRQPFERILAKYKTPTISLCFTADYRIPNWDETHYLGNCGFHSAWVAWMLGANPIILCGFENYRNGTYWWDKNARSSSTRKHKSEFDKRINQLKRLTPGANYRIAGDGLAEHFHHYDPEEQFPEYALNDRLTVMLDEEEVPCRVKFPSMIAKTRLGRGAILNLTPREIQFFRGRVEAL